MGERGENKKSICWWFHGWVVGREMLKYTSERKMGCGKCFLEGRIKPTRTHVMFCGFVGSKISNKAVYGCVWFG